MITPIRTLGDITVERCIGAGRVRYSLRAADGELLDSGIVSVGAATRAAKRRLRSAS